MVCALKPIEWMRNIMIGQYVWNTFEYWTASLSDKDLAQSSRPKVIPPICARIAFICFTPPQNVELSWLTSANFHFWALSQALLSGFSFRRVGTLRNTTTASRTCSAWCCTARWGPTVPDHSSSMETRKNPNGLRGYAGWNYSKCRLCIHGQYIYIYTETYAYHENI